MKLTNSERAEEAARNAASEAYHDHPSNPSSCLVYQEVTGRSYSTCPCENGWQHICNEEDDGRITVGRANQSYCRRGP
jgi:hypothetical protein